MPYPQLRLIVLSLSIIESCPKRTWVLPCRQIDSVCVTIHIIGDAGSCDTVRTRRTPRRAPRPTCLHSTKPSSVHRVLRPRCTSDLAAPFLQAVPGSSRELRVRSAPVAQIRSGPLFPLCCTLSPAIIRVDDYKSTDDKYPCGTRQVISCDPSGNSSRRTQLRGVA